MTTLTPELFDLCLAVTMTALMWVPYTVARIATRGLMLSLGNPDPSLPADPAWAERSRRAHANAVENLVVFAPLVGDTTAGTLFPVRLFLGARLVHYLVYAAGIPVIRTLAFVAGWLATLIFAANLLGL
jgi:uncharacterized MAPEG superfamily protein